jgi:hypothetical protein
MASVPLCAPIHAQYRHGGGGFHSYSPHRMEQPRSQQEMRESQTPMERGAPGQPYAPQQQRSQLAPIERRNPRSPGPRGEHLPQWMSQHSNLTPQQQQQALGRESGFRNLPPQTQQRMRNRLAQLDAMSPEQRQRVLAHTEMIERMTPAQRTDFRGTMKQLGSLPPDQRKAVARTFRQLRELPPDQRAALVNSGRYNWLNDGQRSTLNNLLRIAPLLPPPGR